MDTQAIFLNASKPDGVTPAGGLHLGTNDRAIVATRRCSFCFAALLPPDAAVQAGGLQLLPVGGPVIGTTIRSLPASKSGVIAAAYAASGSLSSQLGLTVDKEC